MTTLVSSKASYLSDSLKKVLTMSKLFIGVCIVILCSLDLSAQVRPVGDDDTAKTRPAAPASIQAKYEGGMFGFSEKEDGNLKFDDVNRRLIFLGKNGREKFSLPYEAVLLVYPNSQSVTSKTGNIVRHIPLPGAGLAGLIKEKRRFLVIGFDDPDVNAKGTVSFRVENKETLDTVIHGLGSKAKLSPRGDAYYRPRTSP
jgi:hypothetical protein